MSKFVSAYSCSSNCCHFAAACSSARIFTLLDTAIALVVSICILRLRILVFGM